MKSSSFHSSLDLQARPYQSYTVDGWLPYTGGWSVTDRTQSVSYQFFPHFHPYVASNRAAISGQQTSLMQRLMVGGVTGLQASDTLYMPQPNPANGQAVQPRTVTPNSTVATLTANVTASTPGASGTSVSLPAGTALTLPDGTLVKIPAGTLVADTDGNGLKLAADANLTLPAQLPILFAKGNQWTIPNVGTRIIGDGTSATLPNGAIQAILSSNGSTVNLPANTAITLESGQAQPFFYEQIFNSSHYNPNPDMVDQPYPVKNLDFSYNGAYSLYNWELFFHAPLLIAVHLSQNQKYQDAQTWFHYIFNPTDNSPGPTPQRFWQVQPFQSTDVEMIQQILLNLSTGQDPALYQETINSINDWKQNPFQPWEVAKYRPSAYMLKTVMAYLDNLIAWGDSLFQQYTIETINEATQLYIMAANILGDKPHVVPSKGGTKPLTYNDLRGGLDAFGNTLAEMEVDIPFDLAPQPGPSTPANGTQILAGIGQTLYFCIPQNDQLLAYWDTVADRLFKIHNSLNLQGVFQLLPLFDPPIDPALLVRATAAGLDVSAVVGGLNQPLPLVRFQFLVAKAGEICQEVISLGANLLSAIEKQDNEALGLMRAQHENAILNLSEMVKYAQWQDAIKARQGLEQSLDNASQRYGYYQKLLGRSDAQIQASLPQLAALDQGSLQNLSFSQTDASGEPKLSLDPIVADIAQNSLSVSDGGINTLSSRETQELSKLSIAHDLQMTASGINLLGSALSLIPQAKAHVQPMGVGATIEFGGMNLSLSTEQLASVSRMIADQFSYEAGNAGKLASYARRQLDWTYQSNAAKGEINQVYKQLRGAQIREAIAQKEYQNHQVQMKNAQQIVDFLQGNQVNGGFQIKETTVGFYAWMKREIKALYANVFQLAFEVAKKSERALQNELGDSSLSFIQYNYLDGNEGLLAGEKLQFDIKTMEMAYHDLNRREYELTTHISLLSVAPLALLQLRAVGSCLVTLPEELFDLSCPGHYFRRIKSVALTIPCIAGPYSGVNCTLTLQNSSIRISPNVGKAYQRAGADDSRFNDYYGSVQSIVTSNAQSDSGMFETNLKDERYLPFEGAGIAGSQWQLTLPSDVRQFDFDTITDVILHVRYTAREGGDVLKAAAVKNLQTLIGKGQTVGSVRLFSIRHDFPTVWAKFQSVPASTATPATLNLPLMPELYPNWAQGIVGSNPLHSVTFYAEMLRGDNTVNINLSDNSSNHDVLSKNPIFGNLLTGYLHNIKPLPSAITDPTHGPLSVNFDNNKMKDLWVALAWGA
ncbi:MAG: insecticidal toxin protein [Burkholderiaceae bacterium]|nr:insecticidal toxin protein [Burkholderiaceae bacterium]